MLFLASDILNKSIIYKRILLNKIKNVDSIKHYKPEVALELTNYCNSRCIFCTHDKMTREKGFIKKDLYIKIINDMFNNGYKCLNLTGFGEPMLNKEIVDVIKYAKKRNILVKMFTNGALLNKELATKILNANLDEIIFSIDTVNKSEYAKTRVGLDLDTVIGNLKQMCETKIKFKYKTVISVQSTLYKGFEKVNIVYKELTNVVDKITFQSAFNWAGRMNDYRGPIGNKKYGYQFPCHLLWYNLVIRWNGEVSLCCVDYDSDIILGNLNNDSLDDVWNSENFKKYRKLHLCGKKIQIKLCSKCNMFPIWW